MEAPVEGAEHQDQDDGSQANDRGPGIDPAALGKRQPETNENMIPTSAPGLEAQQVFRLVEHQQHRGPYRKPDDDRVRDITCQITQPKQRDGGLNDADQEREQYGRVNLAGVGNRRQRAEHGNGDGVRRSVDELFRGTKEGAHGGHDDGRVQTVFRRNARDDRVGHGLRHRHRRNGQTGQRIGPQGVPRIVP
jgi:hypothetical protein